jgi:hypothetical protein
MVEKGQLKWWSLIVDEKNDIRWWQTKLKDKTSLMRIAKKAILKNKDINWLWKKRTSEGKKVKKKMETKLLRKLNLILFRK